MSDLISEKTKTPVFLAGGGELGEMIRRFDWSATSLGPVSDWPKSLRTCVQIMLTSKQPYWIGWGEELIKLYNDPYKAIAGGKHPWALGKPASVVWKDIWEDIQPMLQIVMEQNQGTYVESQLLIMERNGYPEETYYTFSYTPVAGDEGVVEGMICANTDDTEKVLSERQLKTLTDLGKGFIEAKTDDDVFHRTVSSLNKNQRDFPFTVFYRLQGNEARRVAHADLGQSRFPEIIDLTDNKKNTGIIRESLQSKNIVVISDVSGFGLLPTGDWDVAPREIIVLPLVQRGQKDPYGFLLFGKNPFRILDDKYLSFFGLIADQIETSLADVHAIEEERKRLEALAEIDRAKTLFFSNISHEFRTPLTLMLSPLEEVLHSTDLTDKTRENLKTSHRNTLRLQKLVNTLLDFSRIEAGKLNVHLQPVQIARVTEELASIFRSAVEHAGITYRVSMESAAEVQLDVDVYEKIVLNLISNAFKYTQQGEIEVALRDSDQHVELIVSDTGVGIADEDQAKIFERFYRVGNAMGRSQEGSGIGLSMVKELVHLLNGEISVISKPGKGSSFTVRFPAEKPVSLKPETPVHGKSKSDLRKAFAEEALSWTSRDIPEELKSVSKIGKSKILVADDNSDMRAYIVRLLDADYDVTAVTNGEEAYDVAVKWNPDLILSDIMMPRLDGFGLLKKIRGNFAIRNIPVIFLSARAGEEARIEGIESGADDYIVKPFSAKELLARVANQITINKARRESEKQFFNLFNQAPAHIHVMRGPDYTFEFFHPLAKKFTGGRDLTGMRVRDAVPEIEGQGYFEMLDQVFHQGTVISIPESKAFLKNEKGELQEYYFSITYLPWRDVDGKTLGVLQFSSDVSEQVKARIILEDAEYKLQNAIDLAELGRWEIDLHTGLVTMDERVAGWWGLPQEGALLTEVIACIHEDDIKKVSDAVEHAVKVTGVYAAEYKLCNAITKQERFIVAKGKVFYDDNKQPYRMTGIARDNTLQTLAQNELERMVALRTKELNEANAELKRSNEELRQFAYVASHDLREPLRKIRTFSDLAQSKLSDHVSAKRFLEKIDVSAARMSSLISDVLTYSQVAKGEIPEETVDLNEVIDNVRTDFELLIEEKRVTLKADKLPVVCGHKLQFHQLFSNLINNSIKFSEKPPVISITVSEVSSLPANAHGLKAEKYYQIKITDNGIGFDLAYAQQIFQLFSRLHNRTDYEGTGIGLALCRKIVENHGGAITAWSEKGNGSVFTIYLPWRREG